MWSWWQDLPWYLRYGVAILLLLISTGLYFGGIIWPWGWVVGFIMLCLGGPSKSEKNGYKF